MNAILSSRLGRGAWRIFTTTSRQVVSLPQQPKKKFIGMTWKSTIISLGAGSILLAYMLKLKSDKKLALEKQRQRSLGKASIGGGFELVDSEGKLRKSEEFVGKWLLIYFGFTHCPDICPDELEKMGLVLEKLAHHPTNIPEVQALFISVDPGRDTPEVVGKYCKEFSSRLLGLTGTVEQVEKVCKAYRVYFSAGPKDKDSDYIVDHTIIMYLVNPKGEFVDYYGQTKDADMITDSVIVNMAIFDRINKTNWFKDLIN